MPSPIPFAAYRAKLGTWHTAPHTTFRCCLAVPACRARAAAPAGVHRNGALARLDVLLEQTRRCRRIDGGPTLSPAFHIRRPSYDDPMTTKPRSGRVRRRRPPRCLAAMTGSRRCVACTAAVMLLAGCMADAGNSDQATVPGYRYHDANHTNVPSGNASPEAIYNATHGTWPWPPAENDKPNG